MRVFCLEVARPCVCLEPRKLWRGLWGLEVHLWWKRNFMCSPPLSLCRRPAIVSITSVSQNVQVTAILLFSSILLMRSIFLYAKYVEAINTLTCRRCAAREVCPFGRLPLSPASPERQASTGIWITCDGGAEHRWQPERCATHCGSQEQPEPSPGLDTSQVVVLPLPRSTVPSVCVFLC